MKKDDDVHCNLCEKSFSDHEFKNHLAWKHLPKNKFICYKCDVVLPRCNDFRDHLIEAHLVSLENTQLKNFSPTNIFKDCNDIIRHAKESASWIRYAFYYGFEGKIGKNQLKSLVKDYYLQEYEDTRDDSSVCKFCDSTDSSVYCYFCGEKFIKICHLKTHILNVHIVLPNILKTVAPCCEECPKLFRSQESLDEHRKERHKYGRIKDKTPPFCRYCGKCLANKSNLKRHITNQHSEEVGAAPVTNVFTCDYCKCYFSNKSSVKRHIENLHLKKKDTRKSISCFQCEQRFNSIKNLNAHLNIEHDVQIQETKLQFADLSGFWNWKQEEEIRTNARFIQLRGLRKQRRKGEEISTLKFVCNRSGIFHSKSNGKRAYRIKGSSKIGRYCSSYIEITFKDNASVDGIYCSTHSGHDNDLRYLALTMDEKREIYEKIESGATFSAILNEIRNSVGKEIKRKHLVTNKDLHNIVTTFKKLTKETKTSSPDNETLSKDLDSISSVNTVADHSDRVFSNDLDICADLWVETCQPMISHYDHNQSRSSTISESCLADDLEVKSFTTLSKTVFEEMRPSLDTSPVKSGRSNFPTDYPQRNAYSSSISAYSSAEIQPLSSANNLWAKSDQYVPYKVQELDSQLELLDSALPYQNDVARSSSSEIRKDIEDFCGDQNTCLLNDLRMNTEIYSNESTLSSSNHVSRLLSDEMKSTNSCNTNHYCTMQASNVDSTSAIVSCMRDVVADCGKSLNPALMPNMDEFDDQYVLPQPEENQCESTSSCQETSGDNVIKNRACGDIVVGIESNQSNFEAEKKCINGVPDLRDRVNSVTALYNLVESELDERKKNIIRNYVDNMFRVLQYRYNKCKTGKKQSTKRQRSQSSLPKRLNRKRGNVMNQPKLKKPIKAKIGPTNRPKCDPPSSLHFASRTIDSHVKNFSHTVANNIRSDVNLVHWNQY